MMFGDMGWFDEEPPYKPHFKFCPNCGARVFMEGGEEQ
jgi:ribosomal protein S27AE